MMVSQALKSVNHEYVPGVVAYYASQSPDHWQVAHEYLENVMRLQDFEMNEIAAQKFHDRCLHLISEFRRTQIPATTVTPADAFQMDEKQTAIWQSVKFKRCVHCSAGKDLVIETLGDSSVYLVCRDCKKERSIPALPEEEDNAP